MSFLAKMRSFAAKLVLQFVFSDSSALDFDVKVDSRRAGKTERSCNFLKIKLVYIKNISKLMGGISL